MDHRHEMGILRFDQGKVVFGLFGETLEDRPDGGVDNVTGGQVEILGEFLFEG